MLQASTILLDCYPEDFVKQDLEEHIDDLLFRFQNQALGDTIFRVGHDLQRKLGPDDRFMGIIRMANKLGHNYDTILMAMVYGFFFSGRDEYGKIFPADAGFVQDIAESLNDTIIKVCGLDAEKDYKIIAKCKNRFSELNSNYRDTDK